MPKEQIELFETMKMKPFLRWAGGKQNLINDPDEIGSRISPQIVIGAGRTGLNEIICDLRI